MIRLLVISLAVALRFTNAKELPETVVIKTKYGKVEGDVVKSTEEDFLVAAFKGIRYGTTQLFQKPEPVKPWNDTLNARNWRARCFQHQIFGIQEPLVAEDVSDQCLHLNVFAPFDQGNRLRPVMVFIHGGGFAIGSSNEYGQDGIIDWLVPKGAVFVTINYRLGPWGFFSTGNKDAPGNYGLWDQTLALRWVQENIDRFGGDPKKVTVFGQSAGGASAALLALSPHSRDLFQQSILMSGSSTLPWKSPHDENTMEAGEILSTALKCGSIKSDKNANTKAVVECLKQKSTEDIIRGVSTYRPFGKYEYVGFVPVFDGDFFPEPLDKLKKTATPKSVISGVTSDEQGAFVTPVPIFSQTDMEWYLRDPDSFTIDQFIQKLHHLLPEKVYQEWTPLIHSLALHHYIDSVGDRKNNSFVAEQYKKIFSDFVFVYPAYREALERHQQGSKVWFYVFDYYDDALFPKDCKYKGAQHFNELPYLFKMLPMFHPTPFEGDHKKVKDVMTTMWTNFAIYGDPNPAQSPFHKAFFWNPITDQHPNRYLHIGPQPEQRELYDRRMLSFWHELLPKTMSLLKNWKQCDGKSIKTEL